MGAAFPKPMGDALNKCFDATLAVGKWYFGDDESKPRRLHVVHFNDVYNLEPTGGHDGEPIGGAARFAAKLKEMRANDPNILTVFGGDLLGPSMMSGVTKGRHMVNVLNNLGIDYGCFGNHEFDFGMKGLNKTLYTPIDRYGIKTKATQTVWLSTNIDGSDGKPIGGAQKYALVDWHGVKVGLISVSENWLPGCNKLKPGEAVWLDDVKEATSACKELREKGAEVVLLVSHSGITNDKKLMEQMPSDLLDLCCGGHDHDYYRVEDLRIVKAGQEWRYLVDIEFELPPKGQSGPAKLLKCVCVPIDETISEVHTPYGPNCRSLLLLCVC